MTKVSKAFLTAALAALVLGLAACASQKEPAEQALAAIEKKFQESFFVLGHTASAPG